MAEFEEYDLGEDPYYNQAGAPPPASPAPSGPGMPPGRAPQPGHQWMLDPVRNIWVETPIGTFPQTVDSPGFDFERHRPSDAPELGGGSGVGGGGGGIGGGGGGALGGSLDGGGLTSGSAILPNQGFQWPTYNAPRVSFGEFPGFTPFKPPSMEEILADPVLQAQLTEGNQRIKGDRAFRGTLRSGSTLKDIFDWTSDRVKLGANDAFERSFKVYDVNERQNPFNTWSANRDLAFGTFDRNAPQSRDEFLFNQYEPAKSQFQQNYDVWAKQGDWTKDVAVAGIND